MYVNVSISTFSKAIIIVLIIITTTPGNHCSPDEITKIDHILRVCLVSRQPAWRSERLSRVSFDRNITSDRASFVISIASHGGPTAKDTRAACRRVDTKTHAACSRCTTCEYWPLSSWTVKKVYRHKNVCLRDGFWRVSRGNACITPSRDRSGVGNAVAW